MYHQQLICEPIHKRFLTKHDFSRFAIKMQQNTPFTFYRVTLGSIATLQSTFRQLTVATLQSKNATCVTHRAVSFSLLNQCVRLLRSTKWTNSDPGAVPNFIINAFICITQVLITESSLPRTWLFTGAKTATYYIHINRQAKQQES